MDIKDYKIAIIGAGNLATHLGLALKSNGFDILQVISQTELRAATLAGKLNCEHSINLQDLNTTANFIIMAVSDKAISEIAEEISISNQIVVHTSGTTNMDALEAFNNYGVFYPLQTFSIDRPIAFNTIPAFIEANNSDTLEQISFLSKVLCSKVEQGNSEQRKRLHMAAVISCNFVNYLYSISQELLEEDGLPFDALRPLILETASKVMDIEPKNAQTGPAIRNDVNTMVHHLELLASHPEYQKLYSFVSEGISNKYLAENKGNKQFLSWDTLKQNLKM